MKIKHITYANGTTTTHVEDGSVEIKAFVHGQEVVSEEDLGEMDLPELQKFHKKLLLKNKHDKIKAVNDETKT